MDIFNLIKTENINIDLQGTTKEEIFKELIKSVKEEEVFHDKDAFYKDLENREMVGSTTLEGGLSIPHVRSKYLNKFFISIGVSKKGVQIDSLDNEKTYLFILIGTTYHYNNWSIESISKLAKIFSNEKNMQSILNAKNEHEVKTLIQLMEEVIEG